MTNSKTITVATKDGERRLIRRDRYGWTLPPEEGRGAFIDGTGTFKECLDRWRAAGWTIVRQENPHYRPPRGIFRF